MSDRLLVRKEDRFGRFPVEWSHGEVVILSLSDTSSRTAYCPRPLFFQKSSLTHSVAPPLQMRPAALGSHLVFGRRPGGSCIDTVHT